MKIMERIGRKELAGGGGVGVPRFHGLPPGSSCFPIWRPKEEVGHQERYGEVEDGGFLGGCGGKAGRGSRN